MIYFYLLILFFYYIAIYKEGNLKTKYIFFKHFTDLTFFNNAQLLPLKRKEITPIKIRKHKRISSNSASIREAFGKRNNWGIIATFVQLV